VVKYVFGWKDNPAKTPDECEAHYRAYHLKLAREVYTGCDGFVRLVYNRVRSFRVNDNNSPESHPAVPDMDAFIELWFDSVEQLQAAMGHPNLALMFEDHPNFMAVDGPANIRVYDVAEEVVLEA
jgi:uncharacterized protein (TIGR02118 family)